MDFPPCNILQYPIIFALIKTLRGTCFHFCHLPGMRNAVVICNLTSNGLSITFWFATHVAGTLMSKFKPNKYAMCRNHTLSVTSHINLSIKLITHANLVNVSFLCYKITIGNILKPIGMLYNAVSV